MKKFLSSVLIFSILSSTTPAFSDEDVNLPQVETREGEVDPGLAVSPMNMLQKAPFSGLLLSPKLVASIVAKLKGVDKKIQVAGQEAKERAEEVCRNEKNVDQIKFETDSKILKARIDEQERNLKLYEKQLQEEKDSQTNPVAWIGLGTLAGASLTILTVFAVSQATK